MQGLNKVLLIGHLGKNPEYITFDNGNQLAKFSLATSESFKNEFNEVVTQTEWHAVMAWGKLAAYAHKHLKKGHLIYLEGKIKTRSFEDKEGQKKYVTEIVADRLTQLEKKQKENTDRLPTQEELDKDMNLPF